MWENSALEWAVNAHYVEIDEHVFEEQFSWQILKEWVGIYLLLYMLH